MSAKEQLHPSQLIEQQLDLLESAKVRISELIQKDHAETIPDGEVEEFISLSAHVYDRLMELNGRWVDAVRDRVMEFSLDDATVFERHFHKWRTTSSAAADFVQHRLDPQHEVKGWTDLRKKIAFCPYVGLTVDKMMRANQQIETGNVVSFDKVKDGLRGRVVARGQ
jgi:hypothetical protein